MYKQADFWNKRAREFDKSAQAPDQTTDRVLSKTRHYLSKEDRILDFGCASGEITLKIADDVQEIHGIDTAEAMIKIAREKEITGSNKNIHFNCIPIFDESLQENTFSTVLAFNVLHLVDDPEAALQRIRQLLKPGGLIISLTPSMGNSKLLGLLLKLAFKIRLAPKVTHFTCLELENLIVRTGYKIIDSEIIESKVPNCFFAAKRI